MADHLAHKKNCFDSVNKQTPSGKSDLTFQRTVNQGDKLSLRKKSDFSLRDFTVN